MYGENIVMSENKLKILLAVSESVPFIKTGGLADMVPALARELIKQGIDARIIMPKYDLIDVYYRHNMNHVCDFYIYLGQKCVYMGIDSLTLDNLTYYFVDNQDYFYRGYIYGGDEFDGERFSFFCRSVLACLDYLGFYPDIIHTNDWHTGLIPVLLKTQYNTKIKTLYTIHNLKYQGVFDFGKINSLLNVNNYETLEYYGKMNFMKAGIVYSDKINTVSPNYAHEILNDYFGETLDGLLRMRQNDLTGILNGIDYSVYNPETDKHIHKNYSFDNHDLRFECKVALQQELGLQKRTDCPMFAIVSRFTPQKGLDLVECVLDDIMRKDVQLVVLGQGERHFEELFLNKQQQHNGRLAFRFGMNEPLAHRIYSGADFLIMPSEYEPCGLAQMIAMRYGCIPIVRETGGLVDTVKAYNKFTGEGNGFSFPDYNAHELLYTIERAGGLYRNKEVMNGLIFHAMRYDSSFERSAKSYIGLYKSLFLKLCCKKWFYSVEYL